MHGAERVKCTLDGIGDKNQFAQRTSQRIDIDIRGCSIAIIRRNATAIVEMELLGRAEFLKVFSLFGIVHDF